jgi:hypothetical protein
VLRGDFGITSQIRVNAFSTDWNPSTLTYNTWASLYAYTSGKTRQAAPSDSVLPLEFDVTTIVRNWASGTFNNYGLRIMVNPVCPGDTPSLGTTYFQSLETHTSSTTRPHLTINFQ